MDENLIGYLLKALEPGEKSAVEAQLRSSPEARARLEALERALAPLAVDAEAPEPPPGLALAALARVAEHRCRTLPTAPPPSRHQLQPGTRRWGRRADLAVAAVLLILVGGLSLPGLVHQWRAYQRRACAENLRKFWLGLQAYGDGHEGRFPLVEEQGPRAAAGIFVPVLHDAGVLPEGVSVRCPAAGARRAPPARTAADLEALYQSSRAAYEVAARDLAGDYAYSLGYRENGAHFGLTRASGDGLPILADVQPGRTGNSFNHGGAGQNVLYIGGDVRWCTERTVGVGRDDIYLNQEYQILAGVNRTDTCLGPGDASPAPHQD
jgi:hypothetical protein